MPQASSRVNVQRCGSRASRAHTVESHGYETNPVLVVHPVRWLIWLLGGPALDPGLNSLPPPPPPQHTHPHTPTHPLGPRVLAPPPHGSWIKQSVHSLPCPSPLAVTITLTTDETTAPTHKGYRKRVDEGGAQLSPTACCVSTRPVWATATVGSCVTDGRSSAGGYHGPTGHQCLNSGLELLQTLQQFRGVVRRGFRCLASTAVQHWWRR